MVGCSGHSAGPGRERQVAIAVGSGASNAEVAALFTSERPIGNEEIETGNKLRRATQLGKAPDIGEEGERVLELTRAIIQDRHHSGRAVRPCLLRLTDARVAVPSPKCR
jgi:hypothetical protein